MIALWNWLLKTTIGRDFSSFDSNEDRRMNSLLEMTTLLIAFMAKQLLDIEYPLDCWICIRLLVACCSNLWLPFQTSLIESNERIGSMLSWQGRPERKPPDKTTTTKSSCLRTMLIFGLCAMQFFFVSRIDISRATVGFDDLINPLVGKISSNDLQSFQMNESLAVNVRRKTSPSTLEEPRPKLKLFRNRLENSPNARKASQEVDVTSIISPSRGTLPISTQNTTFSRQSNSDLRNESRIHFNFMLQSASNVTSVSEGDAIAVAIDLRLQFSADTTKHLASNRCTKLQIPLHSMLLQWQTKYNSHPKVGTTLILITIHSD